MKMEKCSWHVQLWSNSMKTTIYKNEVGSYGQYELTDTNLDNLASFVSNEVGTSSGASWIKLLNSKHNQLIGTVMEIEQDNCFLKLFHLKIRIVLNVC